MSAFLPFIYRQLFTTPAYPTTDCTGRTIIVTGANGGLGKEAARHLVRLNADRVIITARDASKGNTAKSDIESTTGRKGSVEVWSLDLEDYDSVKAFATKVNGLKRLDAIIENAGKATATFTEVAGNESTITVNVVSTFLLALLVLPKLQETAKKFNVVPNLVIVSSEVHFWTQLPEKESPEILTALNDPEKPDMEGRYPVSKLLEVLACREMTRLHPVSQLHVTTNFLNPGFCRSELARELRTWGFWLMTTLLARTTEVGSRTLVHAGVKAGEETHGHYLDNCKITPCSSLVEGPEGPELQKRVWAELSKKLEHIQPGILKNLEA